MASIAIDVLIRSAFPGRFVGRAIIVHDEEHKIAGQHVGQVVKQAGDLAI